MMLWYADHEETGGAKGSGYAGKANDGVRYEWKRTGQCENKDNGACPHKHPWDQWCVDWKPKGKGKSKGKEKIKREKAKAKARKAESSVA